MSVMAVGVTLDLDGPLPVPRRYSLLTTPGIVQEDIGPDGGDPRWMNGVNVLGYPDGLPHAWEPCAAGTMRVKADEADLYDEETDAQPQARFDPIALYFPVTCSAIGMRDPDRLAGRVEEALDATLSTGVEAALAKGVQFSTNPFLGDSNLDVLAGGAAVSARVGQSYLEDAIALRTGRQGVIHATPSVVTVWGEGLADDPVMLRTVNGTPVISGAGYIGTRPAGTPGLGATESWAFATGPVEVRLGAGPRMDISESLDRSINEVTFRAERYVLAEWDTALQVGVLIDWSL